jgi:mxaK protein
LLRQAIELRAGDQPGQALPLIELAKEQYRELLRRQPQDWNARYNLERAQRLLPDPEDVEREATAAPRERERAATTMRAQTLGLP